ncbi:MAG: hypothetical protein ACLGP3_02105 [Acidobacteriota bacterium]
MSAEWLSLVTDSFGFEHGIGTRNRAELRQGSRVDLATGLTETDLVASGSPVAHGVR